MKKIIKHCLMSVFILIGFTGYGYSEIIPFDSDRWDFSPDALQLSFVNKVEDYLGQQSLALNGGFAVLKDELFTNGIIEYDVALSQAPGYIGAMWRMQDLKNMELFLMRPHNSGTDFASHFYPIFNNLPCVQTYYGDGYNAKTAFSFDVWTHVKIIVSGKNAELYIDNMDEPVLFVRSLQHDVQPGKLGLQANLNMPDTSPTHFANFSFVAMDNPPLQTTIEPDEAVPPGTIMSWLVSDAFDQELLDGKVKLTENDRKNTTWTEFTSENTGMVNVAKLHEAVLSIVNFGLKFTNNTAFVRTTIVSDKEQIKKLTFGFSDQIKVYFNGQLLTSGSDAYGSRDYRFLGIVGYWDDVYLPLKKGNNELWMAVSVTDFAGWGLKAKFEDMTGITITTQDQGDLVDDSIDNECMATYSEDGELYIPCVSVRKDTGDVIYTLGMEHEELTKFKLKSVGFRSP